MRAWPECAVPSLPGKGETLALYDTASQSIRPTSPVDRARMYVCGITPYDATHLGHAATYLVFDLINRAWRDAGWPVDYVQNATDVDDPLLERAAQTGEQWQDLAEREIELFRADMTALRVLPPKAYIGAVEAIPRIGPAVQTLLDRDAAYLVDEDVYFPISTTGTFGYESNLNRDTMMTLFAARGGDPDRAGKRDPLDSLLWRGRRDGEPYWESPMGQGASRLAH